MRTLNRYASVTWVLVTAATLLIAPAASAEDVGSTPNFQVVLKPELDGEGNVTAIAVDAVIQGALNEPGERLMLTAPVVYAGAYGIADRVKDLAVSDANGSVELVHDDDEPHPGGFPYFRHWEAQREVVFPVRLSWRTEVEAHTERRGPPFNIRPSAGGVSGAGSGFLVIPENVATDLNRLEWDLSEFAPGASGISTFGEGVVEVPGTAAALWQGWYLAGHPGRFPQSGDANGFSAAWLGKYPFDAAKEMATVGKHYAWLGEFFGYLSPPPRYRVFMRVVSYPIPRFSGTALANSFMLSGGPDAGESTENKAPHGTFFHEMIHMWVGQVEGPQGVTSWFSEGLTSYYTLVLPVRQGFENLEDYARGVNQLLERHYTSPALGVSAQAIADVGFTNNDMREMPYIRGSLYFADLNARIRAASDGERGLDDLMREIFEQREFDPDYTFNHDAWVAAVSGELGPGAGEEFQARIIDGDVFAPVPGTFGPCFEREQAVYETEKGVVEGYRWVRNSLPEDQCSP